MDTPVVLDAAEERWRELVADRPDLEAAVALQRTLVGRTVEAIASLESGAWRPPLQPAAVRERLMQGLPALRGEVVPLPMAVLGPLVRALCDDLEHGGAGPPARHIRDAIDQRRLESGSLLAASLARNQRAIRAGAEQLGVSPDLLWLVGELAAAPAVYVLRTASLTDQRDGWTRGYCWCCGSRPALAEMHRGARQLRCSFCGAAWQPPEYACIYCAEAGEAFVTLTPDAGRPGRRVEACGRCRGYLKAMEVGEPAPFPLLPIEDLASADLDVAAMEQGYVRPALPDLPESRT